jgi:hypothetical protein
MASLPWIALLGVVGAAIAICFAMVVLLDVSAAMAVPIFVAIVLAGAAGSYLLRPDRR